jgi:hypothetical protein
MKLDQSFRRKLKAKPFGPLFPEFFCMMVTLGLARQRVQPCPRKTVVGRWSSVVGKNWELHATGFC